MDRLPLKVALVREVFTGGDASGTLELRLARAKEQGAELAVLPELPYNVWSPATTRLRSSDAESPGGWREEMQNLAAGKTGMALLGGVIQQVDNRRFNRAILSDSSGRTVARYDKVHLPDEEGFREPCHYEPGRNPPSVIELMGARFGIQICSDANRLAGSQYLAAQGVQVILAPPCEQPGQLAQMVPCIPSHGLDLCAWLISVGRPKAEFGVPIGGPALVVDPMGRVVAESKDPLIIVTLDVALADAARQEYPGYLAWPADLYADGWAAWATGHR
ncbi:MAG: carbon-nitrogen hydrolase family protein [Bacteroidota bacterium]|nr:carbon-nitrogen hydrolase family protein [Bacteroidota bacterium]